VFIVATNLLAAECFTDGWKDSKAGAFGTARGYVWLVEVEKQMDRWTHIPELLN
jgi:hypothetical protein